jgi:hypothetical protein
MRFMASPRGSGASLLFFPDARRPLLRRPIAGLDRHTPLMGLRPVADLVSARPPADGADHRIQRAVYRPITRLYTASSVPLEAEDR